MDARLAGRRLTFLAPGGDSLCGTARAYQLVTSWRPITAQSFALSKRLRGAPAPLHAGSKQQLTLPRGTLAYVAIRAVDAAGNIGRPLVIKMTR
jgi:hypothetical protein